MQNNVIDLSLFRAKKTSKRPSKNQQNNLLESSRENNNDPSTRKQPQMTLQDIIKFARDHHKEA